MTAGMAGGMHEIPKGYGYIHPSETIASGWLWTVNFAGAHNKRGVCQCGDIPAGVAFHGDDIGLLADRDRSDLIQPAQSSNISTINHDFARSAFCQASGSRHTKPFFSS
jgi:hypothetical protein